MLLKGRQKVLKQIWIEWAADSRPCFLRLAPKFTGKSAALIMRKIRPEAMAEAVQLAVRQVGDLFAGVSLSSQVPAFKVLMGQDAAIGSADLDRPSHAPDQLVDLLGKVSVMCK